MNWSASEAVGELAKHQVKQKTENNAYLYEIIAEKFKPVKPSCEPARASP